MQFDPAVPGMDDIVFDHVFLAESYGVNLTDAIARLAPEVLVIDEWLVAALEAGRRSGLRTVAMGTTLHNVLAVLPRLLAANEAATLMLKFGYGAFDTAAPLPAHTVYVGPLRPRIGDVRPFPRRLPDRPLVVASLSTSHQGQEALLQQLCHVLSGLHVEALVTTGRGVDPACLKAGANTTVASHVAHEAVLGQAALLITHAGHGTVMAGLTYGVPMLCLPMGRDQPLVAAQVVSHGLGAVLESDASSDAISAAILTLLADADMRGRSRAFAAQAAGITCADAAAQHVEGLLSGA